MEPLICSVEEHPTAAVVHVRGEVDVASAPKLRETFIEVLSGSPATHLVVNLAEVDFLDSTGIGVIVGAHRRVTANGGRFSVVVATSAVRKTLQVTGLLRAWRVTGTVSDALEDV